MCAALSPLLTDLSDLKKDTPHVDRFLAVLLARLLLCGPGFQPRLLKLIERQAVRTETGDGEGPMFDLLLAALQRLRDCGSPELAHEAACRPEISAALRATGRRSRRNLPQLLRERGLLRHR